MHAPTLQDFIAARQRPLADYGLGAIIDWVRFRVTLPAHSHHRHIRARARRAGLVVGFIEHVNAPRNKRARVFDLTLHDPGTPAEFMRRVQVLAPPNTGPIWEGDIEITAVEIAMDARSRTSVSDSDLVDAANHLFRHLAHPPAGGTRITGSGHYNAAALQGQVKRALRDGLSINLGQPGDDFVMRCYVKRTDTQTPGHAYTALLQKQHRARLEATLKGSRLPFSNVEEWRAFRFETLAPCFAQVRQNVSDNELAALMQDQIGQLGRPEDEAKRAQHRRTSRKDTCRDSALNKRIADALRALTRRTVHDVQSAEICEGDSPRNGISPEGKLSDTGQSAKYLNTSSPYLTSFQPAQARQRTAPPHPSARHHRQVRQLGCSAPAYVRALHPSDPLDLDTHRGIRQSREAPHEIFSQFFMRSAYTAPALQP